MCILLKEADFHCLYKSIHSSISKCLVHINQKDFFPVICSYQSTILFPNVFAYQLTRLAPNALYIVILLTHRDNAICVVSDIPNTDRDTNSDMIQEKLPRVFSANVWKYQNMVCEFKQATKIFF